MVTMRDIIHEQRITLHYQPIVALADRANHHYEVLLRFQDGRSPFEDVKFAEEINIIHELDLAVTQGAIARIKEAAGKQHALSLAVNMSARSLLNDSFLAMFDQLAQAMGKERRQLIVEITESAKIEDLPGVARGRPAAGGRPCGLSRRLWRRCLLAALSSAADGRLRAKSTASISAASPKRASASAPPLSRASSPPASAWASRPSPR